MSPRRLTLYFRDGCSLCEAMEQELQPLQQELGFDLCAVDVDSTPQLASQYGPRVPVLAAEEGELCHYFLDPDRVRRYFLAP